MVKDCQVRLGLCGPELVVLFFFLDDLFCLQKVNARNDRAKNREGYGIWVQGKAKVSENLSPSVMWE